MTTFDDSYRIYLHHVRPWCSVFLARWPATNWEASFRADLDGASAHVMLWHFEVSVFLRQSVP